MISMDRRTLLFASAACAATYGEATASERLQSDPEVAKIRESLGEGARLGFMALDTRSGRQIGFDVDGHYAMCSVFKFPLAAFVLRLADTKALSLSEELSFGPGDPLENSPVVEVNHKRGKLTVEALAAAAVRQSDNSAANLLLRKVGGPKMLTQFLRACGDPITRVDRYEMALNSNLPGDPRDTTTPAAMAMLTRTLLLGNVLSGVSRQKLIDWLVTSIAKPDRLRAGFPAAWRIGHKPGTGRDGAVNDVAIAWPPGSAPIMAASFISGGTAQTEARSAAHRSVAALIAERLG